MKFLRSFVSRVLKPELKKWGYTNQNHYLSLIMTGGLLGFSTFLFFENGNFQKSVQDAVSSKIGLETSKNSKNKNFIANIVKTCAPSVVTVRVQDKMKIDRETGTPLEICKGSGFVVKSDGWILTNAHNIMLKKNYTVDVITQNGTLCHASTVDVDLQKDLALLKTDLNNLKPLTFGNSEDVLPGEWVVAIGSSESLSNKITAGVISSVNRDAKELGLKNISMKYIQTDAALTCEHAGGPLVNLNSEVIGVNNLRVTPGIAFALPVDYVKEFLMKNALKYDNHNTDDDYKCSLKHTCCGITTLPMTSKKIPNLSANENDLLNNKFTGVLVWNVVQHSPAHKAGILPGDLITHINNKPVSSIADLYVKLFWESDKNAKLTLHRRGSRNKVTMELKK